MPKRVGYLYEKMLDKEFIKQVIYKAAKHKHKRREVRRVLSRIDEYVDKMYGLLSARSYVPAEPKTREIYDASSRKTRTIYIVPFYPDAIMHWLLVEAMKPVLMRGMYHWSCASLPGRGTKRVRKYLKRAMQCDKRGAKYGLEIDIRHYYPSISHDRLMAALEHKIKDVEFLRVVSSIIESCGTGIAIGYYICQWLANFYLEPLDLYITTLEGVKYMSRYMDNYTILGPNKRQLHRAREKIAQFMQSRLGVEMKHTWQVYRTKSRMVSAVGYRFAHTHVKLRKYNFLRLTRGCRRVMKCIGAGKQISARQAAGVISRAGQLKHCNGQKAKEKYVYPIGIKRLKEVIRNAGKRRRCA